MRNLRPREGLWGHADFLKLWTGQSISEFGSQISQLAIPWLAAVGLHATPFAFSLLGVLGFLPFILFALPAGVWVDRLRRKPILIVGDSARALLLALIPVLWALGVLQIWHLLVLQFAIEVKTATLRGAFFSLDQKSVTTGCRVGRQRCPVSGTAADKCSPKLKCTSWVARSWRKSVCPRANLTWVKTGSESM